jgi:hypothetical protein
MRCAGTRGALATPRLSPLGSTPLNARLGRPSSRAARPGCARGVLSARTRPREEPVAPRRRDFLFGTSARPRRSVSSPTGVAMVRRNRAVTAAAAAAAAVVVGGAPEIAHASAAPAPDPKKAQAERDVLGFLQRESGRRWILRHRGGRRLFPRLYQPRTGLLRDNTSVRCLRSPKLRRRGRYFCVIRPGRHRRNEGLHIRYIRYAGVRGGSFSIKWRFYRRGS